jgi:hypothetical protein
MPSANRCPGGRLKFPRWRIQTISGEILGAKADLEAGESGIVIELDAELDGMRVVAGFAEIKIGYAKIEELAVKPHGGALIIGGPDVARRCDGLIAVVENLDMIRHSRLIIDPRQFVLGSGSGASGGGKVALLAKSQGADNQIRHLFDANRATVDSPRERMPATLRRDAPFRRESCHR